MNHLKQGPRILLTTLLAAGLAMAPAYLRADENEIEDDDERGGEVVGTEVLESDFDLVPGPNAPVEPGAPGVSGKGFLHVYNDSGAITATLDLVMFGLAFGDYVITTTSLADSTRVTQLGTFSLVPEPPDPVLEEDDEDDEDDEVEEDGGLEVEVDGPAEVDDGNGDDVDPVPDPNEDIGPFIGEDSYAHFGGADGTPFPAGFNPLDIGKLTVTTASTTDATGVTVPGVVVFTAELGPEQDGNFEAEVEIEGADDHSDISGKVQVRSKVKKKKVLAQRFALVAKGLPAKTPVTVTFNGGKSLKLRTTRKGTLGLKRLPKGVHPASLHKVEIKTTADGKPVAHANL